MRFASPPTLPRDPRRGGWQGKGPDGRGGGGQGAKGQGARRAGDREQGTESSEAGRRLGGGWLEAGRKLGGGWEGARRRLGRGWEQAGNRLGAGWEEAGSLKVCIFRPSGQPSSPDFRGDCCHKLLLLSIQFVRACMQAGGVNICIFSAQQAAIIGRFSG